MLQSPTQNVRSDADTLTSFKEACLAISTKPTFTLDYAVDRVRREHPELTDKQISEAEVCYRIFLALCKLHPKEKVRPHKLADLLWHAHILHTRQYERDCQSYFGYFLHHNPDQPGVPEAGVPMSKWIAVGGSLAQADCQGGGDGCTSCGSGCNGGGT